MRLVAVFAALTFAGTVWFILAFAANGGLRASLMSSLLGILSVIGWLITLVAGPVAAVQLWRLKESGRRAGLVLFGYGAAYYIVGLVALRAPEASVRQIVVAISLFALPVIVLLLPRTGDVFASRNSK